MDAYDQQRWADSLDMFKRAESLVHSPVHVLYIARTEAQLGKLVEAQEAYTRISRETIGADAPAAFGQAQTNAAKELEALEPRIPRVTIVVEGAGPDGLAVTLDGQPFPAALVGVPTPMDPGPHRLKATAPGFASDDTPTTIAESIAQKVTVTLKPSADAAAVPPTGAIPGAAVPPPPDEDQGPPSKGTNGLRIGSYVGFGVGAVGVVLGTVFAVTAGSKKSDATKLCNGPGGACPESKKSEIDSLDSSSKSAGTLSVVSFATGAVGIGAGVALFVMSGKKHQEDMPPAAFTVSPWVGFGSAGVNGRF